MTDNNTGANKKWDVVVIGAGIHGAGVAQAAVAAGHSVLVLEQFDKPAQGTSSRSSKLIHGGLRYLETAQFSLVRECLRERKYLLKNAPHLVRLISFYIPVYRNTSRRPWKIAVGLAIYSLFSGRKFRKIPKNEWHKLDGLVTENLDAVFSYYDAQTDDELLTQAVLESARSLGAEVVMGATVSGVTLADSGSRISYVNNGERCDAVAKIIVNAAGAWANQILEKMKPQPEILPVDLVQGTHIILPGSVKHPYYLEAPQDRRAVFVLPWKNNILVGTTERDYEGDPADVCPRAAGIRYLLDVYNHYFSRQFIHDEVVRAFAGLRVLPGDDGKAFAKSRDIIFAEDDPAKPKVITLYGGKLTAYRATAQKVMEKLTKVLPKRAAVADTRNLRLPE